MATTIKIEWVFHHEKKFREKNPEDNVWREMAIRMVPAGVS